MRFDAASAPTSQPVIDAGQVFGRGIGFTPRASSSGQFAWSAGADNIAESLQIILATAPGERLMRPAFGAGLNRFLFEPNTPVTHRLIADRVSRAIERSEPRVRVESVDVTRHESQTNTAVVAIRYRLVATGEPANLALAVAVGGDT